MQKIKNRFLLLIRSRLDRAQIDPVKFLNNLVSLLFSQTNNIDIIVFILQSFRFPIQYGAPLETLIIKHAGAFTFLRHNFKIVIIFDIVEMRVLLNSFVRFANARTDGHLIFDLSCYDHGSSFSV
jgi:hypothetical protein